MKCTLGLGARVLRLLAGDAARSSARLHIIVAIITASKPVCAFMRIEMFLQMRSLNLAVQPDEASRRITSFYFGLQNKHT